MRECFIFLLFSSFGFHYMNTTRMKDCDIGGQIGINDAHYLSIWFKKISGYSVTEYRKNMNISPL